MLVTIPVGTRMMPRLHHTQTLFLVSLHDEDPMGFAAAYDNFRKFCHVHVVEHTHGRESNGGVKAMSVRIECCTLVVLKQ